MSTQTDLVLVLIHQSAWNRYSQKSIGPGRGSFCAIYGEEEREERGDKVVGHRFMGGGRGGLGGAAVGWRL